jgi:hypothetical protein
LAVLGEKMRYKKVKAYAEKDIIEAGCFNKNKSIAIWCLKVRDKYNIKTAVETGTCRALTTEFLVEAFDKVYTIDVLEEYVVEAKKKFAGRNVKCLCGNSVATLETICEQIKDETVFFFLDAHGNYIGDLVKFGLRQDTGESKKYYSEEFDSNLCPAKQEIEMIAKYFGNKCVIIVDDVYNPHNDKSGHINFGGIRFGYDYLRPAIEKCFDNGHKYDYICGKGLGWPKSVLILEPKEYNE